ncbi:hypothetical protein D187_008662 [Cystobacter fuscus DSM 2262]|uniref:VCBS repeat-containing protein n=1 Tax=Cystobacter fuscus (strain ATCC 25194 / DSM 2262 / NBRC 100088 / M29) TaxID=1242864 RepID=S9QMG4_CYSF2|nr:FG-GAP-like repeat-containing protein [Cystobacter fuscus]EPX62474.1 hypothetical protein D187_008662 [Cystobacter fuscus DSM 2262]
MRTRIGLVVGAGLFLACGVKLPGADLPALPGGLKPPPRPSQPSTPPPGDAPKDPPELPTDPPSGSPPDSGGGDTRGKWLRASFYAGVSPEGLAVGDFNGDGAPDVAINAGGRNYSSQYVSRTGEFLLLRNDGTGRLALAEEPFRLTSSGRIVAGDADGDGHLDALVGTRYGLRLLLGKGDGAFVDHPFPWRTTDGVVSSLGLWPSSSGPSVLWSLGNYSDRATPGGTAGFYLLGPSATGTWSSSALKLTLNDTDYPVVYGLDTGRAAAIADFDEDGLPDVAFNDAQGHGWRSHVLLGTASGHVQPSGELPTSRFFRHVYAADFNRDGHVDLLGAGDSFLELFLGNGHGGFSEGHVQELSTGAEDAAVVDFDGDGAQDVVALHGSTSQVSLFRGKGDGTLVPHGRLTVGRRPSAAAVADLDHDGEVELLVAEADDNTVSVYTVPPVPGSPPAVATTCPLDLLATPIEERVHPVVHLQVGQATSPAMAVGDFDGDGRRDLALVQGSVRLVLNQGNGVFTTREVPDLSDATSLAAGDFDGDGRVDLAVTSSGSAVFVLWNDPEGHFEARQTLGRSDAHGVRAGDFNADGRVDLVASFSGCVGKVSRFTNLGSRTFREDELRDYNPEPDDRCPGSSAALAGDFNGDGTLDLVHTTLGINLNPTAKDGTPLPGHGFDSAQFWNEAWSVDADGDGRLDVVNRVRPSVAELRFYPGDGHGTLRAPFTCALPPLGRLFAWEDVNGDGRVDVIAETQDGQGLWLALGQGQGKWSTWSYPLDGAVTWARAVDLLGDDRPELVVLMSSGELRVFSMS